MKKTNEANVSGATTSGNAGAYAVPMGTPLRAPQLVDPISAARIGWTPVSKPKLKRK